MFKKAYKKEENGHLYIVVENTFESVRGWIRLLDD